jgi:hypothetical protein
MSDGDAYDRRRDIDAHACAVHLAPVITRFRLEGRRACGRAGECRTKGGRSCVASFGCSWLSHPNLIKLHYISVVVDISHH